jgi:hypothetical protein
MNAGCESQSSSSSRRGTCRRSPPPSSSRSPRCSRGRRRCSTSTDPSWRARRVTTASVAPLPGSRRARSTSNQGALTMQLRQCTVAVEASPYTPLFGAEEVTLLRSLGPAIDLAFGRVRLSELERQARLRAEATNQELEALLYGISHDLRTPSSHSPDTWTCSPRSSMQVRRTRTCCSGSGRTPRTWTRSSETCWSCPGSAASSSVTRRSTSPVSRGRSPRSSPPPTRSADRPSATCRGCTCRWCAPPAPHQPHPELRAPLRTSRRHHPGRRPADRDELHLSVSDDGVGIPPEYRDRVFGIFERLQGRDEAQGGTGVGLAMCRKIVEQAGGRMWIADTPLGTDIRFVLPAATAAPRTLEASP